VKTGLSDGRDTAILDGDLTPGTHVVTGNAATPAAPTTPSTSPLLPFGRGGRGGGR
jgi:hypothetical protein